MAAKIEIEEYLIKKFLKIQYQLEGKILGETYAKQKYTYWLDL